MDRLGASVATSTFGPYPNMHEQKISVTTNLPTSKDNALLDGLPGKGSKKVLSAKRGRKSIEAPASGTESTNIRAARSTNAGGYPSMPKPLTEDELRAFAAQ